MKLNVYVVVFGVIGIIIVAAGLSALLLHFREDVSLWQFLYESPTQDI